MKILTPSKTNIITPFHAKIIFLLFLRRKTREEFSTGKKMSSWNPSRKKRRN